MNREEILSEILRKHKLWLKKEKYGEQADLSGANLKGLNFTYADLSYSDLSGADLSGANLAYVNLKGANLRDTNLSGVSLRDTDLNGVNLSYTDLSGADLREVNIQNVFGQRIIALKFDTSRKNSQLVYWVDIDVATTGCFQGSLEDLKSRVEETHKDNKVIRERYRKAISFIEEMIEDYKK